MLKKFMLLLIVVGFVFSCSVTVQFLEFDKGELTSERVRIVSTDGEFEISPHEEFVVPQSLVEPEKEFRFFGDVSADYPAALKLGAKKVYVFFEDTRDTLFGVLHFSRVPQVIGKENYEKHRIILTRESVSSAFSGKITYTGVKVNAPLTIKDYFGWVLWVSNYPFYEKDTVLMISGTFTDGDNVTEPRPSETTMLRTKQGFIQVAGDSAAILLMLELKPKIDQRYFTRATIQNPNDPANPFVYDHYIDENTELISIRHGHISGLQIYQDYTVRYEIFAEEARQRPIDTIEQKIRSYVDTTADQIKIFNKSLDN